MSAATPRLPDYLQHIIEAIERIQRYTEEMDDSGSRRINKRRMR